MGISIIRKNKAGKENKLWSRGGSCNLGLGGQGRAHCQEIAEQRSEEVREMRSRQKEQHLQSP